MTLLLQHYTKNRIGSSCINKKNRKRQTIGCLSCVIVFATMFSLAKSMINFPLFNLNDELQTQQFSSDNDNNAITNKSPLFESITNRKTKTTAVSPVMDILPNVVKIQIQRDVEMQNTTSQSTAATTPSIITPVGQTGILKINPTFKVNKTQVTQSSFPMPVPNQVLRQYKEQHSHDALLKDPHGRKYAMVYFSCPMQAGNRLHHFYNSILWSIVTNRTVLYKYYDNVTCDRLGGEGRDCIAGGSFLCRRANTEADCDAILRIAEWLPRYDYWKDRLLPDLGNNGEPDRLHLFSTRGKDAPVLYCPWQDDFVQYSGTKTWADKKFVHYHRMVMTDSHLVTPAERAQVLHTTDEMERATKLHELGLYYMYGMLFRELITFVHPWFREQAQLAKIKDDNAEAQVKEYTIALHSRHKETPQTRSASTIENTDIRSEMHCIQALNRNNDRNAPCVVYAMADRPSVIELLRKHTPGIGCTVRAVSDHATDIGLSAEHGPWAGMGFYQDLSYASQARDGLIMTYKGGSTASVVLKEVIMYDRYTEVYEREGVKGVQAMQPLHECGL